MHKPETLTDVCSDGLFLAAAHDLHWRHRFGTLYRVEYNFHVYSAHGITGASPDIAVDVRLHTDTGIHDVSGTRVAQIHPDSTWQWLTDAARDLEVPQLHGSVPSAAPAPEADNGHPSVPHGQLLAAARTLVGGAPVFIAPPTRTGRPEAVIALNLDFPRIAAPLGLDDIIVAGLQRPADGLDESRAIAALQTMTGLQIAHRHVDGQLSWWGPAAVPGHPHPADASVRVDIPRLYTDAFYMAREVELLWEGRFDAGEEFELDLRSGLATCQTRTGVFSSPAHLLATVTDETWTWAWADANLGGLPVQQRARALRDFGRAQHLAALLRPSLPAQQAGAMALAHAAMPVLRLWHLQEVELTPETSALVLLEQPALPALREDVAAAVLATPTPRGIGKQEAEVAYLRLRGKAA